MAESDSLATIRLEAGGKFCATSAISCINQISKRNEVQAESTACDSLSAPITRYIIIMISLLMVAGL
jgi:hypothetical protein